MKQFLHLLTILLLLAGCEKEPKPVLVSVTTGEATAITTNSASVQVSMDENDIINEIGVLCSADSLFNTNTIKNSTQDLTNTTYRFALSNLSAGTKYYYRAYAASESSSIYGSTKSFQTKEIELSTSIDNIGITESAKTYPVEIRSNTEWKAVTNQEWCTVSPESGTGRDSIYINVQANTSINERQAVVTVTAGNKTKEIKVTQSGIDASLSVSSNYFSVSPEGGTYDFQIDTNLSWTISSNQSWCTVSSSSGNGNNKVSFRVAENTSEELRTAVLTVQAGTLTQKITIEQQSKSAMLAVSTNSFSINAEANTYSFTVTSNMDWTVSSNQSWCSVLTTHGSGNQDVSFQVGENTLDRERNATIMVKAGSVTQAIVVTQEGKDDVEYFKVSPDIFYFGPEGGEGSFTYTEVEWKRIRISYSKGITLVNHVQNKVDFTLDENTTTETRVLKIVVGRPINDYEEDISATVTIVQKGMVASTLSVSPKNLSVGANGGTVNFAVASNSNWTVQSNNSWCVPQKTIGSGNDMISCVVNPNTLTTSRTAIVTVNTGGLSEQVTITQEAVPAPVLTVSPKSLSVKAEGGTIDFTVSANRTWTVQSNSEWCVPQKKVGTGNEIVSCVIEPNTQYSNRTAIISVNSEGLLEQITVTQDAAEKTVEIIDIPDANFKTVLLKRFDLDKDGEISVEEAQKVTYLSLENNNIKSLEGLQYFTSITYMSCYNNQISEIDLSKCTQLERLTVGENNLTSLDISQNLKLKELNCAYNSISYLDVSNNQELTRLYCIYNNLSSLDVSKNLELKELQCSNNNLNSLNVRNNRSLTYLTCANNNLTDIDVSQNTLLETFYCCSNQFSSFDLSKNINLTRFECCKNQVTNLDFSKNTKLVFINCYDNLLTTLDVSNNLLLERLDCFGNPLETLILKEGQVIDLLNGSGFEIVYK